MPRLTVTDFNSARYFGHDGNMPGGYGRYQFIHLQVNPAYWHGTPEENDSWHGKAQKFIEHGGLAGLKVLELGCAFGSLVRHLRQLGADAYGLDLSWPISQGIVIWPELQPYLIIADARTWIFTQARNSWDAVISRGFLDCLSDADLAVMVPQLNKITKLKQVHSVDPTDDPEFYNLKTLAEWQALPWEAGTLIVDI